MSLLLSFFRKRGSGVLDWIIDAGVWYDTGYWIDTEQWVD